MALLNNVDNKLSTHTTVRIEKNADDMKFTLNFSLACKSITLTALTMDPNVNFRFKYGNNLPSSFHLFDPLLRCECERCFK